MRDTWHAVTNWMDHNRWTFVALVFMALLTVAVGTVGCDSKADFVRPDGQSVEVTRPQLATQAASAERSFAEQRATLDAQIAEYNAAVDAHNKAVDLAEAELGRQDAIRSEILASVQAFALQAADGTLNPAGLITGGVGLAGTLLGLGALADNRRKDRVIREVAYYDNDGMDNGGMDDEDEGD